ncbi:MAG: PcfJ domain-containing protein, partial [Eubacteriales bacterium]
LRGYYIEVTYSEEYERPDLDFTEMVRYELKPGEVNQVKRTYSDFYGVSDWQKCKTITEPWPRTSNGYLIRYDIAGLEDLAGTFLAYLPYAEFIDREYPTRCGHYGYQNYTNRVPWAKILSCAALYPMFELCVKAGMWDIVNELICFGTKNARYLNWDAETPKKFFRKVPTADAKKLMHETDIVNALKFYRHMTNNADKAITYSNAFQYDFLKSKARELADPPQKIADYLIRQGQRQSGLQLLIDYRNSAVQLGRNINVPSIRFPRDLVRAHDEYHAAAVALRREKEQTVEKLVSEKYSETRENYRRLYEYQRGEYIAMVPSLLSDIRLEGEYQHHCVAGYIDRHAKGKTIIIFIRRVMYPAIPLYTAEISPTGTLRQVQGYHNEDKNKPTPDAYEFIYCWLAEIQKRLAKEAKKQKTEEKTA